jgi:hypothetical protein
MLRTCGLLNRDKSVSIGIVNRNSEPTQIILDSILFHKNIRVYEYDTNNVPRNDFADIQDYSVVLDKDAPTITLKPNSVTFFTTDYQEKAGPVVAKGLKKQKSALVWNEVSDPNHCYYRVYADKAPDFVPNRDNQIASTVATNLPITDSTLYYKVLSVDCWGNV